MFRSASFIFFSLMLFGCSGGSGSTSLDEDPTPIDGTPTPRVSGLVSLGPVENIRVTITNPENEFHSTTTTDINGKFDSVEIPAGYDGPLLISAAGEINTYFICDNTDGCRSKDNILHGFGEKVPFSGELALYLPSSSNITEKLTLSPFSTAAAARASTLGLNADNIRLANEEMQMMLDSILEPLGINFSKMYYKYPFLNLAEPQQEIDQEDTNVVSALLTLLGSILFNASEPGQQSAALPAEEFLKQLNAGFSAEGNLSISSLDESAMSWEKLLMAIVKSMSQWSLLAQNNHPAAALLQIIEPVSFDAVAVIAQEFLDTFESISSGAISISLTEENLGVDPIVTKALILEPDVSLNRLAVKSRDERIQARLAQDNGTINLLLSINPAAFPGPQNSSFSASVIVGDTQGELRSLFLEVPVHVLLDGLQVATNFSPSYERDLVLINATDNRPSMHVSYYWTQVGGQTITLNNPDTRNPSFVAPELTEDATLTFRLEVSDSTGTISKNITVPIAAYTEHEDIVFSDSNLSACYKNLIDETSLEDAGAIIDLDCSGFAVSSLSGINELVNLASLDVSGDGSLTSLTELETLKNLKTLDLSGQELLRCSVIAKLESALPDLSINAASICNRDVWVELSGEGFDTAFDASSDRLFVSLLQDRKIVVIDTRTFRVLHYIDFPAGPRGLSISLDGTRLFAALYGANAVAIVSLSDLSIELIDLQSWPDSSDISDVLEVEPDRLIVTSGGGSYSRAIQIHLNDGNAISYVSNSYSLKYRSTLVADEAQKFAYIGTGDDIYKLDLAQADAPIVLNRRYSSEELLLNHDGSKLITSSGGILNTDTLQEEISLSSSGSHAIGSHPDRLYQIRASAFEDTSTFRVFEFNRSQPVAQMRNGCREKYAPIRSLTALGKTASDFVWVDGNRLCGFARRPLDELDPTPEFAVPDPQLEKCIRSEASAIGARTATELTELRCTDFPGITSLRGLERFRNLTSLHTTGGSFFDLDPLLETWWPQSRISIIDNSSLADVSTLINRTGIQELDVTNSKNVPCSQLDLLRDQSVNVISTGCVQEERLELGGSGAKIVVDELRDRYYVSIPSLQQIKVIDATTFSIIDSINMDGEVTGLALSVDGSELIATYYDRGVVAYMNIGTRLTTEVDVSSLLGTIRVYDVEEVSPGVSIVTGNGSSGSPSYVVRIDRTTPLAPQLSRVANSSSIRQTPVLSVDRVNGFAYISESFSPNALYKIDISQEDMPLVLKNEHGKVYSSRTFTLTPEGHQIITGNQRLSSSNFRQTGITRAGRPSISSNGMLGVWLESHGSHSQKGTLEYIDKSSLTPLGRRYTGCNVELISALPVTPIKASYTDFLVMASGSLCRVPAQLPMPD